MRMAVHVTAVPRSIDMSQSLHVTGIYVTASELIKKILIDAYDRRSDEVERSYMMNGTMDESISPFIADLEKLEKMITKHTTMLSRTKLATPDHRFLEIGETMSEGDELFSWADPDCTYLDWMRVEPINYGRVVDKYTVPIRCRIQEKA